MNILIASPHPDDETLGAGGTLLRFKEEGNCLYWLNFTNMKMEYGFSENDIKTRLKEIEDVKKAYGFKELFNLELEPGGLDKYSKSELIATISGIFNKIKPSLIILPFRSDIHSDHTIVFDSCYSCTKSFRYPFIKKVVSMEIISETDFANPQHGFIPNLFIDISKYINKKIEIMQLYKSEIGVHPFPRSDDSIWSLAQYRGATAGVKAAEAFLIIKEQY